MIFPRGECKNNRGSKLCQVFFLVCNLLKVKHLTVVETIKCAINFYNKLSIFFEKMADFCDVESGDFSMTVMESAGF